jgi:hypothetical protein
MHALREWAAPVNRHRPDPCHLCRNRRLCGVAHLEVIRAAATGHKALAADRLINLKVENSVEHFGEARAAQRDRLNEEKADAPFLRHSARLAKRCANDRPLELLKAVHDCRIGKRPCRESLRVEGPISAARIRHGGENGVAK